MREERGLPLGHLGLVPARARVGDEPAGRRTLYQRSCLHPAQTF